MRCLVNNRHLPDEELFMPRPEEIDDVFSYHAPTPEQVATLTEFRNHMKAAAHAIAKFVPECPYRTVAFRRLHEANMLSNAAIVLEGRSLR